MFRHVSAIFRESTTRKEHKINTSMQVLIPSLDGTSVPEHVGVGTHHELHFAICILLNASIG